MLKESSQDRGLYDNTYLFKWYRIDDHIDEYRDWIICFQQDLSTILVNTAIESYNVFNKASSKLPMQWKYVMAFTPISRMKIRFTDLKKCNSGDLIFIKNV